MITERKTSNMTEPERLGQLADFRDVWRLERLCVALIQPIINDVDTIHHQLGLNYPSSTMLILSDSKLRCEGGEHVGWRRGLYITLSRIPSQMLSRSLR